MAGCRKIAATIKRITPGAHMLVPRVENGHDFD